MKICFFLGGKIGFVDLANRAFKGASKIVGRSCKRSINAAG